MRIKETQAMTSAIRNPVPLIQSISEADKMSLELEGRLKQLEMKLINKVPIENKDSDHPVENAQERVQETIYRLGSSMEVLNRISNFLFGE